MFLYNHEMLRRLLEHFSKASVLDRIINLNKLCIKEVKAAPVTGRFP
jgi:hypothetical protein